MLEIKHLITLKTIEQTTSIAETARVLNLTLSAVSHQLKTLEDYYQCTLFIRKTNPVQFTHQGRGLLTLADQILPLFREAEYQLRSDKTDLPMRFNIALECHSCYQWLIPTLGAFRENWPQVETDLSTEFHFDPLPELLSGELSLVITADPVHHMDLEYTPLFDFEMMAGVAAGHRLAHKPWLVPEDLVGETIISYPVKDCKTSIIRHFLQPAGITPANKRTTELTLMAIELAASGKGICCLPNWAFAEYASISKLQRIRLGEKGLTQTLYIATRYTNKDSPLVSDFIRLAKTNCLRLLDNITLHQDA